MVRYNVPTNKMERARTVQANRFASSLALAVSAAVLSVGCHGHPVDPPRDYHGGHDSYKPKPAPRESASAATARAHNKGGVRAADAMLELVPFVHGRGWDFEWDHEAQGGADIYDKFVITVRNGGAADRGNTGKCNEGCHCCGFCVRLSLPLPLPLLLLLRPLPPTPPTPPPHHRLSGRHDACRSVGRWPITAP